MKLNFDFENFEEIERDRAFDYRPRRRRKKRRWLRLLLGLTLALIIIATVGYLTVKFLVGPIVKTVDALPGDFPEELTLYEVDRANVTLQNPESRQRVIEGIRAMPDWLLNIFLSALSDDLKARLAENFGEDIAIARDFDIADLKTALQSADLEKSQTVNLSWQDLGKTKEELADFYKQKLAEANFEFKENLADYEINLGFWKDGVFGTMSFINGDKDNQTAAYNSNVEMTVNYFK